MSNFSLPGKGLVYTVRVEKFHKIGQSSGLWKQRLMNLENSVPFPVTVVYLWYTDWSGKLEAYLHQRYASFRMHGEWFQLNETHIEELSALDIESLDLEHLDIRYQVNVRGIRDTTRHPLTQWRYRHRLRQSDLAERCRVQPAIISQIENWYRIPQNGLLEELLTLTDSQPMR